MFTIGVLIADSNIFQATAKLELEHELLFYTFQILCCLTGCAFSIIIFSSLVDIQRSC